MFNVKLTALTIEMPSRRISNDSHIFEEIPETSSRWWKFWGIQKRGYFTPSLGENEYTSAYKAVKRLLNRTQISPEDIDILICASSCPILTDGPDVFSKEARLYPRLSTPLKRSLKLENALSWDVQMECASFLLAVSQASAFIKQGKARHALVVCSEYISNMLDFSSRSSTIFADGCAAALLSLDDLEKSDLLASAQHSNADFYEIATACWRTKENSAEQERLKLYFTLQEEGQSQMQAFVPHQVPIAINRALEKAELTAKDIDFFIFHQPSPFLVDAWASGVGCPDEKTIMTMAETGVMVSVSIPFTLFTAIKNGKITPGHRVVLAGAATGWGFAAQVWRMDEVLLC